MKIADYYQHTASNHKFWRRPRSNRGLKLFRLASGWSLVAALSISALMVATSLFNDGFNLHSLVLNQAIGYLALVASILFVVVLAYPVVYAANVLVSFIGGFIVSSGKHPIIDADLVGSRTVRAAPSHYASARYLISHYVGLSILCPTIFAFGLLIVATGDGFYAYYDWLRLAVSGIAVYLTYRSYRHDPDSDLFLAFAWIAVLFNPIILPTGLAQEAWATIDALVAIYLLAFGTFLSTKIRQTI